MLLQIGQEYSGGIVFALSADRRSISVVSRDYLKTPYTPPEELFRGNSIPPAASVSLRACRQGGHADWQLPTITELEMIYTHLFVPRKGRFNRDLSAPTYISSTPWDSQGRTNRGMTFDANTNLQNYLQYVKYQQLLGEGPGYLRAVRTFEVPVTGAEYNQIQFTPSKLTAAGHKIGTNYQVRSREGGEAIIFHYEKDMNWTDSYAGTTGKYGLVFATGWLAREGLNYPTAAAQLNYAFSPRWAMPSIGQLELIYRNCYVYGNLEDKWNQWLNSSNLPSRVFWSNSIVEGNSYGGPSKVWGLDFGTGMRVSMPTERTARLLPVASVAVH